MGKMLDTISTINSAVRTALALVVCGGLGTGGFYAYNTYNAQEIKARLAESKLAEAEHEIASAKQVMRAMPPILHLFGDPRSRLPVPGSPI